MWPCVGVSKDDGTGGGGGGGRATLSRSAATGCEVGRRGWACDVISGAI